MTSIVLDTEGLFVRPSQSTRRLAIFDLDRTLVPGSSLLYLGRALAAQGHVRPSTLAVSTVRNAFFTRRGAADATANRLREAALHAVAGLEAAPLLAAVGEVAAAVSRQMYSGARLLLRQHREAGHRCVILSSGPHDLVDAVAALAGADHGVGTRVEIADGRYTGKLIGPFCYGDAKLQRLREELGAVDLSGAYAYTDSSSDLPLLRAAGQPVAVNPDRRLRAVARGEGWPILSFGT